MKGKGKGNKKGGKDDARDKRKVGLASWLTSTWTVLSTTTCHNGH